jgi:LCP family protein required for cell wall assembly
MVIAGAVLLLSSGTAIAGVSVLRDRYEGVVEQQDLFGGQQPQREPGEDINGPLNILLAGLDTRPTRPNEAPRADTVIIVHVTADLRGAYMISLPRDALVEIPPYEPTGYLGQQQAKLNGAMFHGAKQLPGEVLPDVPRGFALLSQTVSQLTGIDDFDAGAVINFIGFRDIVDAMGGVTVELDQPIVSQHRQPDGQHRGVLADGSGYYGPQMVYEPGVPPCGQAGDDGTFVCDLSGWQALDIARQRYGVEDSDYGRQRNQQVILEAMMEKALSRDIVTDPLALDRVLRAAGESLTFDGRGHSPIDFAFALRHIRPDDLVTVQVDAGSLVVGGQYQGEELRPRTYELFAALQQGRIEEFLLENRDLVE